MGKGQGGIFPRAPAWSRSLSIPSLPHPVTNRRIGRDLALCFGALSRSLSGIGSLDTRINNLRAIPGL